MPTIIDLNAAAEKLTVFRGRTPRTTFAERKGSAVRLGSYRDGMLLLNKSAGKGHWETHPEDELVYVLDGVLTVDIVERDEVRTFELHAGMMVIVPPGAWHRVHSVEGVTSFSATIPGEHIDLDVADPRAVESGVSGEMASAATRIVDLNAELAKLTMFRRTPAATAAEREGSVARLAPYRDGYLFAVKSAGTDHWEAHPTGDELIIVLDGTTRMEIVGQDGPRAFELHAGMLAVIPSGAWHRFRSDDGATVISATPFPSEHIELDVDDPRTARGFTHPPS